MVQWIPVFKKAISVLPSNGFSAEFSNWSQPGFPAGSDRWAFGLVPGNIEAIVGHRPRHLQEPARGRKRAILSGVGGELVKYQGKAHRSLAGRNSGLPFRVNRTCP